MDLSISELSTELHPTHFARGYPFHHLSERPFYSACPRWLIDHGDLPRGARIADLGCGSGILTQFLLNEYADDHELRIFAIDPSEWELAIARERITDPRVTFVQGTAEEATAHVSECDAVFLCNVLHQIPLAEREPLLAMATNLLRPGGILGCNTLFYRGGLGATARIFNIQWMQFARAELERLGGYWKDMSKDPPPALQHLSPGEHEKLLRDIGLADVVVEEIEFDWEREDWEALCRYSVFIRGALSPDVGLEIGQRALIEGMRATYDSLGIQSLRRGWLHCSGRRPAE